MSASATFNQVAIKALAVHSVPGGGLEIGDVQMGSRSSRLQVCLRRWVANNCLRECGTAIAQKQALHTLKRTPCLIIGTGSHEPWHPCGSQRKHKHNSGNLDIQLPMITENQGLTKGHRQHALRKKHQHQPEAQKKRNLSPCVHSKLQSSRLFVILVHLFMEAT